MVILIDGKYPAHAAFSLVLAISISISADLMLGCVIVAASIA